MNRHYLEERLRARLRWLSEFNIYREHRDISEKVATEIYNQNPVMFLIFKIYILPTLIFNQLVKLNDMHNYRKVCREIEIIQNKMEKNKNQK